MPRILEARWAAERRIDAHKSRRVEIGIGRQPRARIARQQRDLQLLRHRDPRILQERGEVISRRPHHRILEIEQAERARCLRAPAATTDWVNDSRAAPRSAAPRAPAERLVPERAIGRACARGETGTELGQQPVRQQVDLDQQGVEIVARQSVVDAGLDRQHLRQRLHMQRRQQVGGGLVACRRSAPADRRRPPHRRRGLPAQRGQPRGRRRRSPAPITRARARRLPWRGTGSRPRPDGRWRCRACRRAPAGRPAAAANSSGCSSRLRA